MLIGVFDSGIGGKAVAAILQRDFPTSEILYVNDEVHVPYGARSQADIAFLTDAAIQPLLKKRCDVIVLACNTATAAAIETLRARYPDTPFIGLEPMVRPAAVITKSKVIAVCATPFTIKSKRYLSLKQKFAADITVLEPDCSEWATMIENDTADIQEIADTINQVCIQGADVIVLACTHYHWIKDEILKVVDGRAEVIDPSDAISKRVSELLRTVN